MSETEHQSRFARDLGIWLWYAWHMSQERGFSFTLGDLWRSQEQQDAYVEAGLSWTRDSWHLRRTAIDFNLIVNGQLVSDGHHPLFRELHDLWLNLSPYNYVLGPVDAGHLERRRTPREGDGESWEA